MRPADTRRRYDDACAATHGMDIIGERWALPVMRELMLGPRRFSELRGGLPGISANVLTQRLKGLEANGVVRRRRLPPPASAQVYELTPWGYEAGPIFQMLGRWAVRSPGHDKTAPFSATALMLSMRAMGRAPPEERLRLRFEMQEEFYSLTAMDGEIAIGRGERLDDDAAEPDLAIAGEPGAIAAWLYAGADDGEIAIEGDRALAEGFRGFFVLPEPVAVPG